MTSGVACAHSVHTKTRCNTFGVHWTTLRCRIEHWLPILFSYLVNRILCYELYDYGLIASRSVFVLFGLFAVALPSPRPFLQNTIWLFHHDNLFVSLKESFLLFFCFPTPPPPRPYSTVCDGHVCLTSHVVLCRRSCLPNCGGA